MCKCHTRVFAVHVWVMKHSDEVFMRHAATCAAGHMEASALCMYDSLLTEQAHTTQKTTLWLY